MDKYTPGPWRITYSGHVCSENDLTLVAVAQHSRSIDANARLIAAAPELLEALRPFAETDLTVLNGSDTFAFDVLRARAAIAKVEGMK